LLPERLTKDPSEYVAIITNGSGPMPAWGSRLSADEINALVDYILSTP
jgi:mono/diheme cytochrome c family protein